MIPKRSRCPEDGYPLRFGERCPNHPHIKAGESWPGAMVYSYNYVCGAAQRGLAGADLDNWCRTVPLSDVTGANHTSLEKALAYARKWRLPEFVEGCAATVGPEHLYGKRG